MKNNYLHRLVLTLSFALLLYYSPIISQNLPQKTISGTITDADGPLSGVNVLVKSTSRGSISDLDGRYSLPLAAGNSLAFIYFGYKTEVNLDGNKKDFDIVMVAAATTSNLDQVIINADCYKVFY
ncbi:MAG: carboxypeptidase-like regulatory domain-containing protein [Aequorivita sp.]